MTIRFVANHPFNKGRKFKALANLFKWQLFSRAYRVPVIHQFTQNSKLFVWKGLNGAIGKRSVERGQATHFNLWL